MLLDDGETTGMLCIRFRKEVDFGTYGGNFWPKLTAGLVSWISCLTGAPPVKGTHWLGGIKSKADVWRLEELEML